MSDYTVYLLKCSDGTFYAGITGDYQLRLNQHAAGAFPTCYTFKRRPVTVVYVATFTDVHEAIHWEKVLKGWSRRKKEAVIAGEWEKLPDLAKCDNSSRHGLYRSIRCHAERSRSALHQLFVAMVRLRSP